MSVLGLADEFQGWPQNISVVSADATNEAIRITGVNHLRSEIGTALEQTRCVGPGGAFSLTPFEERIGVSFLATFVVTWVVGFVFEIQTQFLDHVVNSFDRTEQNGMADVLVHELGCRSQNRFFVALWENDAFAFAFHLIDHLTHDGVGFAKSGLQFFTVAIDVEFFGVHARHAFVNGGLGHGSGLPNQHPSVKGFGNDVLRTVLHHNAVVGGRNVVRNGFLRQRGEGFGGGHLHVLCDVSGSNIKGPPENVGKPEDVVDLIGVVGASRGDDGVVSHLEDVLGKNFRVRIGEGEHDGFVGHAGHHFLRDQAALGKPQEDIGAFESVRQVAGRSVLSEGRFVFVQLARIKSGFRDDALAVNQRDVAHLHAHGDVMVGASNG